MSINMKVWIVWNKSNGPNEVWNIYLNQTEANQDAAIMNETSYIGFFDTAPYWVEEWPIAGTV